MTTTPCLLFTSQKAFAFSVVDLQLEVCPDATLDEGVRELACQAVYRSEARAVCGNNDRRDKRSKCIAGLLDDRFGGQATEVEPADDRIDLLNAGQFLGIAHGIDDARMTTTGHYDKSFVSHMEQDGLIIQNEGVTLSTGCKGMCCSDILIHLLEFIPRLAWFAIVFSAPLLVSTPCSPPPQRSVSAGRRPGLAQQLPIAILRASSREMPPLSLCYQSPGRS